MAKRRKRDRAEDALLAELAAVYRDLDQRYAGHGCPGSTECCRFGITGREPYVTSIEAAAVARAVAARGGQLNPKKRALPIAPGERTCPLLNQEARCAVYASRPLGCRSFWCDRAHSDAPVKQPELNEFVRRVKDIAARHRPDGGDLGRPLTRALL
jgi:Fe-S-cluster containining protein